MLGEDGIEFVGDLREQQRQVNIAAGKHDVVEVEARDVEEFLDECIQAVRLVERDARKASALLNGQVGSLLEKREVAHHARQRRFEVVREIGDEVVFAAGLVAQSIRHLTFAVAHAVDSALHLEKRTVKIRHVLGVLNETVDHMRGDRTICQGLAAVVPHVIHRATGKKDTAHREREQKAAEHEQVVEVNEKPAGAHREKTAQEQDDEPRKAAERNCAAGRDKPVDEHVPHHDHNEEGGEVLARHHRERYQHEYHDGEQAAIENVAHLGKELVHGVVIRSERAIPHGRRSRVTNGGCGGHAGDMRAKAALICPRRVFGRWSGRTRWSRVQRCSDVRHVACPRIRSTRHGVNGQMAPSPRCLLVVPHSHSLSPEVA